MIRLHLTRVSDPSWRRYLRRLLRTCGGELMVRSGGSVVWTGLGGRQIKAPLPMAEESSLKKFIRKLRSRGFKV